MEQPSGRLLVFFVDIEFRWEHSPWSAVGVVIIEVASEACLQLVAVGLGTFP